MAARADAVVNWGGRVPERRSWEVAKASAKRAVPNISYVLEGPDLPFPLRSSACMWRRPPGPGRCSCH
jgi:hypothetical protein